MHLLTICGLVFNAALILIDRSVHKLPNWLFVGGMLLGIGAMIAGAFLSRT